MTPTRIKNGIKFEKFSHGFSIGAFINFEREEHYTTLYLFIGLGFWAITIGRFGE